jgi:diguanylate cyclase (GGDEF)-like protein
MRGLLPVCALALLSLASGAFSENPGDAVVVAPRISHPITIDGDPGEWSDDAGMLEIREAWQSVPLVGTGRTWDGPDDLSGTIWVAVTDRALVIGGRIRDDQLSPSAPRPWEGDAVEVFFDVDLTDSNTEYDDDDYQLILSPLLSLNRWTFVRVGNRTAIQDRGADGIRVAGQETHDAEGNVDGYTFEAWLPLLNFPRLQVAAGREMGFNIALVDAESGPGQKAYLTWNGQSRLTDSPERFGRLRFEDALQAEARATAPSVVGVWRPLLIVFGALALLGLGFLLRPLLLKIVHMPLRVKLLAAAALATAYLVTLVAPEMADRSRLDASLADLKGRADTLRQVAAEAEDFGLVRVEGLDEDRASLVRLLRGKTVPLPVERDHVPLWARAPKALQAIGDPSLPFLDYAIPVKPGTPFVVPVQEPEQVESIAFVVSYTLFPWARARPPTGRPVARVQAHFENAYLATEEFVYGEHLTDSVLDSADAVPEFGSAEVFLAKRDPLPDGRSTHAVVVPVTIPLEARGSRLHGLEIQTLGADGDLVLHGVTFVTGEERRPLVLGGRSLTGIPYRVRNDHPRGAERILHATDEPLRIEVLAPERAFDRAWLLVALASGYQPHRYDSPVAIVRMLDGEEVVAEATLRSGIHLARPTLYTLDLPASMKSRLAFRWGGEHRDEVEMSIDPPRNVTAVEIERTDGDEALIVAGVTLGAPLRPHAPEASVLVEAVEPGSIVLTEAGAEATAPFAGFAVATGGRVLYADSPESDENRRLQGSGVPPGALRTIAAGEAHIEVREIERSKILLVWVAGPRPGDIVGAWVPFRPAATLASVAFTAGIVCLGLLAPLILLCAVDLLGRLRRLRLKLVLAFAMASLVPLLLLFFLMKNTLLTPVEEQRRERLAQAATDVGARLTRLVGQVETAAQGCSANPDLRDALTLFLGDEEMGSEEIERRLVEIATRMEILPDWHPAISMLITPGGGRQPVIFPRTSEEPMLLGWSEPRSDLVRAWSRLSMKGVTTGATAPLLWTVVVDLPGDRALLDALKASLGGRLEILLYSPRGHPLAGTLDQTAEGSRRESRLKLELIEEISRMNAPVIREIDGPGGRYLAAYDLLKDRRNRAVALVGVAEPQAETTAARARIRDMFVGLAAITLLLELIIGSLLTRRITGPVLDLERVVREVRRGNLDARAETAGLTDEVGALARAFNHMTDDLSVRLGELRRLNDGIRRLTTHLERNEVVDAALRLLHEAAGPEMTALLLAGPSQTEVEILGVRPEGRGISPGLHPMGDGLIASALTGTEPRAVTDLTPGPRKRTKLESSLLRGNKGAVILPLTLGSDVTGAALILYAGALESPPDNLPFLSTLAGQVAVALENARLYRLAIEDGRTGLYVHSYFMARMAEEVDRSIEGDRPLSLLVGALEHSEMIEERHGPEEAQRVFREVVQRVRDAIRRMYVMGRTGRDGLEILLPEADKRAAMAVAVRVREAVSGSPIPLGDDGKRELHPHLSLGLASCPEDAQSSEFLLSEAERALRRAREDREDSIVDIEAETKRIEGSAGGDVGEFVFRSDKMIEILETVERIARSDISILLRGETGVGKEVIAELVHRRSHRRDQPLVNVNCAALPEALLEAELFGHEKGAFTGADRQRLGRFEVAHGGTIFLDEIGEMTLATQVKILRVLQDKTIERLGGHSTRKVDVRVIAATNRELPDMIARGTFREDLYFRLNVVSIVLPPLRARKEEIPALADRFLTEFGLRNECSVTRISPEAMDVLYRHSWPGNVRELKNTIERAMVIADGDVVLPAHLKLEARHGKVWTTPAPGAPTAPGDAAPAAAALNARQARILEILRNQHTVSTRECAEVMNVSERTTLRDLTELIALGHVEKTGSRRAALYRLPE